MLKDIFTNEVKVLKFCNAESLEETGSQVAKESESDTESSEAYRKVSRSAAMIGLAISVGTTGVLLPGEDKAVAADAIKSQQTMTRFSSNKIVASNLPQKLATRYISEGVSKGALTQRKSPEKIKIAAPAIVHTVSSGETISSISQKYKVASKAIASYNNLLPEANLLIGQRLRIPTVTSIVEQETPDVAQSSSKIDSLLQQRQNYALKNLKDRQQSLKQSLAQLKTQQSQSQKQQIQKPILLTEANASYVVKPGDTLDRIARMHGVSMADIVRLNKIRNPNEIEVNTKLQIPRSQFSVGQSQSSTTSSERSTNNRSYTYNAPETTSEPKVEAADSNKIAKNTQEPIRPDNDTYIRKLRADIERLREEYQRERANKKPAIVNNTTSNLAPTSNELQSNRPEWLQDRLQRQSDRPRSENSRFNPQTRRVLRLPVLNPLRNPVSGESKPKPDMVGSSSTDAQNYNRRFSRRIGNTISPQLPPLSSPEQYLPDTHQITPGRFNGYIWPAKGVLTSGYGWRWGRMHKGIDIAGPVGTPIMAAAPGEVIHAGWNSGGYGNLVKVKHSDGSVTIYAHNSRILVRRGEMVSQGQQIAKMGSTGFSTGPHLHFEIHPRGRGAVNPSAHLPRNRR